MLGSRWNNFQPSTPTLRATMHSVTDRQTDGRTDNRLMPIADHTVAVRSANNSLLTVGRAADSQQFAMSLECRLPETFCSFDLMCPCGVGQATCSEGGQRFTKSIYLGYSITWITGLLHILGSMGI